MFERSQEDSSQTNDASFEAVSNVSKPLLTPLHAELMCTRLSSEMKTLQEKTDMERAFSGKVEGMLIELLR